ncbi:IclR family transcriptional regulator C-terminal domain-containing protein [Streptomyces sp. NPDC051211]|uniref:IclR family transcriptional regulator domain-containing protein n=1 Tax=Streptomyces sp. NPDC051211 TaxID=3154643 RepID=UPI00344DD0B2
MSERYPQHGTPRPRSLAEFLARAGVRDRYQHYDLAAAEARLLHARATRPTACPRAGGTPDPGAGGGRPGPEPAPAGWSDPARDAPVDAERAWRDLKAAAMATVCAPRAGTELARFIADGPADPAGAQVFACLLHLTGLHDGARFWWQFSAGAGTGQAAYCLFLDHSRRGEHHDAGVWARQLARLGFSPPAGREPAEPRVHGQSAVLRYVDRREDPDLGLVPLPRPGLEQAMRALLPPHARPVRTAHRRHSPGPLRHPALTAAARRTSVSDGGGGSAAEARRALDVVRILGRHPQGVRGDRLGREAGLAGPELGRVLAMLCEEQFAHRPAEGVFAPGPALDRLAAPGGHGLAAQLQHTLALARDSAGAAVYLSRYVEGEVRITQMADGPAAPPVNEWFDFKMAAHASAVGKCLLTQLDHDGRADHVARHKPARLTARTITDSRVLFNALDAVAPGDPVFDLREYSPGVVCSAVPITTGGEAGSLALSMPAAHAHRLPAATRALRRKTVPLLLALLLTGALPPDEATAGSIPDTLRHLRSVFRTPLEAAAVSAGPHLVSDASSATAYLFDAPDPDTGTGHPALALPHAFSPFAPPEVTGEGLLVLGM